MSLDAVLAAVVAAEVERRLAELQRPELVHQRSVEQVIGLPRAEYLRLARAAAFPTRKERRLILARTVDVVAALAPVAGGPRVVAVEFSRSRSSLRRVSP